MEKSTSYFIPKKGYHHFALALVGVVSLVILSSSMQFVHAQQSKISGTTISIEPIPPSTISSIDGIIGVDERVRVEATTEFPWRAIADLDVTFPNGTVTCTGFFVGPHTVATAGHCVYDPQTGEWASSIKVMPGRNSFDMPFGSETVYASSLRASSQWANLGNPEYDYGAIVLPNNELGNQVGSFKLMVLSDEELPGRLVNISGYPADKFDLACLLIPGCQLWLDGDPVATISPKIINYGADTYGGQSGSPVWYFDAFWNVIAIHTRSFGDSTCDQDTNCGTRITQEIIQKFQIWGGEAPPVNDNAIFISDVTIPDGTVVSPSQSLVKTWQMRNTGTSTWDGYQLVFVSGNQMSAPNAVAVPHTAPGQTADISVNLTAPNNNGEYTSYWRLRNPQGTFFGPTIWVNINVSTASSYISVLTVDPPSPADTNQVTIHARTDNFPNFRAMRLKIDGNVVYELGAPEFYYDWQTDNYTPGEHTILVEVADWTDLSWDHPETRAMTYGLTGNGAPTNHAPYPPNPTSPNDWHVYYSGNTAQLCAQDAGDPDGDPITQYQFDIHDSAQLWNSGWVSSNCVTTGSLGPYSYQWRVKVRDSQGAESGWSNSRHFTLVNPDLTITELYFEPQDPDSEAVKIRACTDGQGGVGITMRVSVNDATDGSDSGEWHILKELGVPCFNADDAPIWFTLPYGDGPHLVRVEAHGSNTGWDGATIRQASYTLPYRRPPSSHLVAPVPVSGNTRDPIYLNGRTITFRWQPTLRATSLTLHISTNPSPKDDPNPVFRETFTPSTTEHQITFSQDYPTLYWQLDASNSDGTSASGDQQFGIDRVSPSCSIGTLPDTTFENVFQVSWTTNDALSGVKTADIQYQDSRQGEWRNWLTEIPATQTYDLFYGEAGHTYQFRCRATDNASNSNTYSESSNEIQVDPTARPAEPWWDTAYAHKRGILVLNNMSASNLPAGYPVHIRFDNTTTPSAADIYNASTASIKCDDLRVVYNHSLELDRYVAGCQIDEIDIWFQSQAAINPGDVDDASYRLYYGNALAENPPADQTAIWYPQLDANTVGLWYFSEGLGSTTSDYSGYGNHGTIGILTWADDNFGHALTSPYHGPGPNGVFIPGNASLGSPVFTLEFFAKRYTMHPEGYIAGMGMSGNGRERMRLMIESPGKIKFQIDPEPGGASDVWANSGCLADLEWHHVAVTFDGDRTGNIYCDGVLAGSGLFNESGISSLNFDLHLGSDFSTGTRFNGAIDQVRLSNIVRTSFPYAAQALITNEPTVAVGDSITPPTNHQPDLAIVALRSYPNPEGGILIEAVLKNEGDVPTQNGFFTDLYWDHVPLGPGDYTGSLQFWVNSPIQAGDIITVTTVITDMALLQTTQANNLEALQELNGTIYAQVDSTGAVGEANNTNNISSQGTQVCVAGADVYEGDNNWQVATAVSWDSSQRHNVHILNDEDWFAIQVTANQTYTIKTTALASSADTYLYLYDTDGTTLLTSNDDYNGSLASQVDWLAPTTGTYYVQVKHWNPNVSGCNTGYTILFGWTRVYLPIIITPVPQENTIPNAPTNFRVVNNPNYLVVAWNDNSFIETQYEIKFRVTGSSTWQTAFDSANIEQRIFDYLSCGTSYEMYVYAVYWPFGGQRYESASSNWIYPNTPPCN